MSEKYSEIWKNQIKKRKNEGYTCADFGKPISSSAF